MKNTLDASDILLDKLWYAIFEKQQSINRQLEESEKKLSSQMEENNRLAEESEKKLFKRIDKKNLEMKEVDFKIIRQLEENKIRLDDEKIEKEEEEENKKNKRKSINKKKVKKDKTENNIDKSEPFLFTEILKLLGEQGYKLDEETLKKYWELVTRREPLV